MKWNEAIAKVLWFLHSVTWLGLFVPTYLVAEFEEEERVNVLRVLVGEL